MARLVISRTVRAANPFSTVPSINACVKQFARATNPQIFNVIELLHHFPLPCCIGNTFRSIAD